ncbi:MAG: Lrp/AsnC family transcriptional regulator [Novosphingobium pentaromativorans]|uniref:Lrp/AsnC family transcriptional regulator n=2 Tax=Novosphingobium TaxID=165696 RepID=A0A2W5QNR0_9SPHN|nr:MAG: Lrp/AsnC family transcriptional regulator [Novosphingobium pentaromativorans]
MTAHHLHGSRPALHQLDETDFRLMRALVSDGRASDVWLGEKVHLSSTAVARRRKILEESGHITNYSANLNAAALGFGTLVVVSIELVSQAENVLQDFETAVLQSPSMRFCAFISGDTDFLMILNVHSLEDYDMIYRKELSVLPHVSRIRSSFVLREVANRQIAPVILGGLR